MHKCSPKCIYFPSVKQPVEHRITLSGIRKTKLKFYCGLTERQIKYWDGCPYYKEARHDNFKRKVLRDNKKDAKNG